MAISQERLEFFAAAKKEMESDPKIYSLVDVVKDPTNHIYVIDHSAQEGCHYRGIFIRLIEILENEGLKKESGILPIRPDTAILVETTTGNAGIDFFAAATKAGYEAAVIIPDGLPSSRYRPLERFGQTIIKTPPEGYALNMPDALTKLLRQNKERLRRGEKMYVSPNHSMGRMAQVTTLTMATMIDRFTDTIDEQIDLAIFGMGNGSSVYGPAKRLREFSPSTQIVAVESIASGGAYEIMHPGKYEELFGLRPGDPRLMAHYKLFGLNAPISVEMPSKTQAITERIVDEIELVTDNGMNRTMEKIDTVLPDHRQNFLQLPNWELTKKVVESRYKFGNSSMANISVALQFLENKKNTNVLCIVYDGQEKYEEGG